MKTLRLSIFLLLCSLLGACAGLTPRDPLQVDLAGVRPLPGEDLELRFLLQLRVLNPNETPVDYRGLALSLDIDGKPLARGVSDRGGRIEGFGEALIEVPMSVSAFSATRQFWNLSRQPEKQALPYRLHGKFGAGPFGSRRFSDEGLLDWSQPATNPAR